VVTVVDHVGQWFIDGQIFDHITSIREPQMAAEPLRFGCGWAAAAAVTRPLCVWDWLGCHRLGFRLGRVGVDGWAFPSSQRPW
jgi:hypothetical protein